MWRLQAVAAVLGRPRQENRHALKGSQGYKVRSCFKSPVKQKTSHSLAVWGFPPCKGPSGSLAQADACPWKTPMRAPGPQEEYAAMSPPVFHLSRCAGGTCHAQ